MTRIIALKRRLKLFPQYVILWLRQLFRLPSDALRDQHRQHVDRQVAETLQNLAGILNLMQARLHWYETRVPLIHKEYILFCAKQDKLRKTEKARQDVAREPERDPEPAAALADSPT